MSDDPDTFDRVTGAILTRPSIASLELELVVANLGHGLQECRQAFAQWVGAVQLGEPPLNELRTGVQAAPSGIRPAVPLRGSLLTVARELNALAARRDARSRATKSRFNLFTVLLSPGDETRLHSRWLAHLLDPRGSHDCGPLFLRAFIDVLSDAVVRARAGVQAAADAPASDVADRSPSDSPFAMFNVDAATVHREVRFEDGRIDILIDCPKWGGIVLENKIWAADQERQLQRYDEYLEVKYRRFKRHGELCYLTLGGRPPSGGTDVSCRLVSYQHHVLPWLEECLRTSYAHVGINQALQQYRQVVRGLTGLTSEEQMEEVAEVLRQHPEIIRYADQIVAWRDRALEDYRARFFGAAAEDLRQRGHEAHVLSSRGATYGLRVPSPALAAVGATLRLEIQSNQLRAGVSTHDNHAAAIAYRARFDALRHELCTRGSYPDHTGDWDRSWPAGGYAIKAPFFDDADYLLGLMVDGAFERELEDTVRQIAEYAGDVDAILGSRSDAKGE